MKKTWNFLPKFWWDEGSLDYIRKIPSKMLLCSDDLSRGAGEGFIPKGGAFWQTMYLFEWVNPATFPKKGCEDIHPRKLMNVPLKWTILERKKWLSSKASFLRKTHLSCFFFWGGGWASSHPISSIIHHYPSSMCRTTPVFGCFLPGQCRCPAVSAIHVRQRSALVPPSANPVGNRVWRGGRGGRWSISQSTILLEEILHQLIWRIS